MGGGINWGFGIDIYTLLYLKLEKEMATHSSLLAWRIPGTGESGGLSSVGSPGRTRLKRLSSSSIFKIDNQQRPTVQHRELWSIFCNSVNGKRI